MIRILPTDTCYGISGNFTKGDYQEIYRLKGRDFSKPLAFLVKDFDDLHNYIEINPDQINFLKKYPHPWSILGTRKENCILPDFLDANQYSKISLRIAKNCMTENVYKQLDFPLFLTSANLSGQPESTTLEIAQSVFLGVDGIDGGICNRPPSDIFSFGENNELIFLRKNSQ